MDPAALVPGSTISVDLDLATVEVLSNTLSTKWPLPLGVDSQCDSEVLSTDAALCRLGVELSARIAEVRANALAARLRLETLSAASAHTSELLAGIDRIEAEKVVALETQQVMVDGVLEELRDATKSSAPAALDAISGDGVALGALFGRLSALVHRLRALPRVPVEPGSIDVTAASVIDVPAASLVDVSAASLSPEVRVIAPRALLAGDFVLGDVPRFAMVGLPIRISISIEPRVALSLGSDEAAAIALSAAVTYINVASHVVGTDAARSATSPSVSVSPNAGSRRVELTFNAPPGTSATAAV